MEGYLSKTISLILCFVMLVLAPLIITYGTHDMEARNELLSDVSEFLDKVADKHAITQSDLDIFSLTCQSHGMTLHVEVDRLVKTVTPTPTGNSVVYIAADDISKINSTDIIRVRLKEDSMTPYRKLLQTILGINRNEYSLTLTKMAK